MIKQEFKFEYSENTACFVCDHVMHRLRPILLAIHTSDEGDDNWQFLCGHSDHDDSNIKIISLKQATEIDQTINDLYEMPIGVGADRESVESKWEPFRVAND